MADVTILRMQVILSLSILFQALPAPTGHRLVTVVAMQPCVRSLENSSSGAALQQVLDGEHVPEQMAMEGDPLSKFVREIEERIQHAEVTLPGAHKRAQV